MKAFRYYLIGDDNKPVSPFVSPRTNNSEGKYGSIPLVNLNDDTGTYNTAKHNGTSIIIAPNKKHSIISIGNFFNRLIHAVAQDDEKIGRQLFNRTNNFIDNSFNYDEVRNFYKEYLDMFDGDKKKALDYIDSGIFSPLHKEVLKEVDRSIPQKDIAANVPMASFVYGDAEDKDEDRLYSDFVSALTSTHDMLANHYGKNNIGLYQVEYDPEDQFTGKDYLENKETAQVDYPAEGKVKVSKVYPGAKVDYDKFLEARNKVMKDTKTPDDRNEAFRGIIKPTLLVDPSEIASDERLKVLKAHKDWINTQKMIPAVQRGIL